jgi:type IV pilus assembly protein PilC
MNFQVTALNPSGVKVKETVQAESDDQALRRLQSQGYVVLTLSRSAERGWGASRDESRRGQTSLLVKRARLDHLVIIVRELAIMIETGVPITEALEALEGHAESAAIRIAVRSARLDLMEGRTISQAFAAQQGVFPAVFVNMVRTAEYGGQLGETLNQAADYLESSLEMRNKVITAVTYPSVLMVVAVGVTIFMLLYIVPKFGPLFAHMGAEIPESTKVLLALSAFLQSQWWLIPIVIGGGAAGVWAFLQLPFGKTMALRALHSLPMIGDIAKKVALARILRSLGTLNQSGVALLVALEISSQTAQDVVFERAVLAARDLVADGHSLAEAVAAVGTFPRSVCQMMSVGEKSGRLSDVLMRVAMFFERDVDAKLKTLSSIIEPVMIVVLGVIIGFIAIAIISPIYSLIGSVK